MLLFNWINLLEVWWFLNQSLKYLYKVLPVQVTALKQSDLISMTNFNFLLLPTLVFYYFGNSREHDAPNQTSVLLQKTAHLHITNPVHKQILQGKTCSEVYSILRTVFNAMAINCFDTRNLFCGYPVDNF